MDPITDFVCTIGDAVINILQKCMTGNWGSNDFKLFNGGFLVASNDFFTDDEYKDMRTTEQGEVINPNDPDEGFNKTKKTGKTQDYYIPVATYSPEQIFSGNVQGLDINFINPNFEGEYLKDKDGNIKKDKDGNPIPLSSAAQLQSTIATWYVALRNLTVVGLLSVLVYVGIRIIMSITASDKAKYKQMLMDWLIALCLVFFLHYIMSFTLTLTQSISEAIAGSGEETVVVTVTNQGSFKTNLLGLARFKTQYHDLGQKVAYLIMYMALVIYTVIFTWFYLKRLLMMAFLTLIAPVVALTYPIDKISDGKAQAFDSWLKEYIFNALIQPFHLIIYTVFVGSAMDLASSNIIYMIAALAFILPAEKILRKFFGFEKAGSGTLGALTGFTAASLLGKLGKGGSSAKLQAGKTKQDGDKPPRYENKNNNIDDVELSANKNGTNDNTSTNSQPRYSILEPITGAIKDKIASNPVGETILNVTEGIGEKAGKVARGTKNFVSGAAEFVGEGIDKVSQFKPIKGVNNFRKHHNLTVGGAWKGIKGVAKFGTKKAFSATTGTLAGAIALASGGGLGGATTAFVTAANLGGQAVDGAFNIVGKVMPTIGHEIDVFNGDTNIQNKIDIKEWKKDESRLQYLKDKMTADNNGIVPSNKAIREKMNSFDPYLQRGITDIKDMLKAQKTADTYKLDPKQAALIAAIGKDKGITADILNDDKKARAYQLNLEYDLIKKDVPQGVASKKAEYTMNILKDMNGINNNLRVTQQVPQSKNNRQKPSQPKPQQPKPQQPKPQQPKPQQPKPPRTKI